MYQNGNEENTCVTIKNLVVAENTSLQLAVFIYYCVIYTDLCYYGTICHNQMSSHTNQVSGRPYLCVVATMVGTDVLGCQLEGQTSVAAKPHKSLHQPVAKIQELVEYS